MCRVSCSNAFCISLGDSSRNKLFLLTTYTIKKFNSKIKNNGKNYQLQTKSSRRWKRIFALEISGGIEMVQSQTTGQYYATAKKPTSLQPLMKKLVRL